MKEFLVYQDGGKAKQKAVNSLRAGKCPGCEGDCYNCEAKYIAYNTKEDESAIKEDRDGAGN